MVRVLDEPVALERFTKLWRTRHEVEAGGRGPSGFPFELDIAGGEQSGRWLYSADGVTQILSVKRVKRYRVDDAAALNEVLGVD